MNRWRKPVRLALRRGVAMLPDDARHALLRRLVRLESPVDPRLTLKIADTHDELAACFRLLHDAYVGEGYMKPDPSGMRVTIYHALPTTTTLCAKWDGEVVGTLSMIREGVFGFPMQSIFDLAPLRARTGQIAEISALAVAKSFRRTGGRILFPLMKFLFEYCRGYFDTRHMVIAVHPNRIDLYEALLLFQRLQAHTVDHYDFANGAPAVGASLDVQEVPERVRHTYRNAPAHRDLHRYFVRDTLPNIQLPERPMFTTNDPVMTPALLDAFFNRHTRTFEQLDLRRRLLLHSIYDAPAYRSVLPPVPGSDGGGIALRRHQRFSLRCPAVLMIESYGRVLELPLDVVEISKEGMGASAAVPLPEGTIGRAHVRLGARAVSEVLAQSVRCRVVDGLHHYGFKLLETDDVWRRSVEHLEGSHTHADLSCPRAAADVALAAMRTPPACETPRQHVLAAAEPAVGMGAAQPTV